DVDGGVRRRKVDVPRLVFRGGRAPVMRVRGESVPAPADSVVVLQEVGTGAHRVGREVGVDLPDLYATVRVDPYRVDRVGIRRRDRREQVGVVTLEIPVPQVQGNRGRVEHLERLVGDPHLGDLGGGGGVKVPTVEVRRQRGVGRVVARVARVVTAGPAGGGGSDTGCTTGRRRCTGRRWRR